jgi:cytochrome c553
LQRSYAPTVATVAVPDDESAIARGGHLARSVTVCTACHGDDLAGTVMADAPGMFRLVAPNLTAGGVGAELQTEDFVRAIRHGVARSGRGLLVMHSDAFHNLAEADLAALIAFVRSLPPVENRLETTTVRPLGRVLFALGMFDSENAPILPAETIDHDASFEQAPPEGPTSEYGAYLASITLCYLCHGQDFRGAPPFDEGAPAGRLVRTGMTPSGRQIDPHHMPWDDFNGLTDVETAALWSWLRAGAADASVP